MVSCHERPQRKICLRLPCCLQSALDWRTKCTILDPGQVLFTSLKVCVDKKSITLLMRLLMREHFQQDQGLSMKKSYIDRPRDSDLLCPERHSLLMIWLPQFQTKLDKTDNKRLRKQSKCDRGNRRVSIPLWQLSVAMTLPMHRLVQIM